MKRPVILVDLDNVVYDFIKQFAFYLDRQGVFRAADFDYQDGDSWYNKGDLTAPMQTYRSWSVWENWGIPKGEFIRWWRLGIENGEIYKQGPLIPGSRRALWQLSDAEWDIHIATSRLTKFGLHDTILENTAFWLRDNNIPYRNVHFTDDKVAIFADAIVDDRADNMDETVHSQAFEFPANHNQGRYVTPDEQVAAWQNIVSVLTEKVRLPEGA